MAEPSLDLSEIIDLYREDGRLMVEKMRAAHQRWDDFQNGGAARAELRRMSHQLRGSGRTYGFRHVTRYCKAIENMTVKVDKKCVAADERLRESIRKKLDLLATAFAESSKGV